MLFGKIKALVEYGVRTGLISVPQRNMHTPAEVCDFEDMENIAKLTPPSAPRRLRSAMHAMGQRMNSSTLPSRRSKISLSAAFSHREKRTS